MTQTEFKSRNFRTKAAKHVSRKSFHSRLRTTLAVAGLGYAFAISGAIGPSLDTARPAVLSSTFATLSYEGDGPVISGSVEKLFGSDWFNGPNRSQKVDRRLPRIDALELARSFIQARTLLADLKSDLPDPVPSQRFTSTAPGNDETEQAPRISLAAIDPALASAALNAIEAATPIDPSIPLPSLLTDQLSYSRENTPATERAANKYSERERWCLSTAVYFEARGESYRGQVAVAQVVMNRVKHDLYPDTICGVVFQNQSWRNRCQFSFACDGVPERVTEPAAWAQAREITEKVTADGLYLAEVANATHYHANYVYPAWAPRMKRITRIGAHIFYRFRG